MVPGRRGQRAQSSKPSLNNLGTLAGPRSLFMARYRSPYPSVNVCNFIDDLGVSASIEFSWLRYHVKTRARRGSSFSQLGLEPNHQVGQLSHSSS